MDLRILGLVFWVTCYTDGILADRCRCGGVAGAGSHQTPGDGASRGVFSPAKDCPRVVVM